MFTDFIDGRLQHAPVLSAGPAQAPQAFQALAQQSFESPLITLPRRTPVAVGPGATAHEALALMQARGVGSVLALDAQGAAVGILTRHDLLPRFALREPPPDLRRTPATALMSTPVHTLDIGCAVQDAVLLMSRQRIRHVPLTEHGRVVSLVSERDLFALQRGSVRQLGSALRRAPDLATLRALAPELRAFARQLLAQGVGARALTALVSHLNDLLTERLVMLLAQAHGLDLERACWVAFGSEGRSEQTVATDQDNGLVLDDAVDEAERARWMAMAQQANEALDGCGYPLCKGGIMAGRPACCLRQREWAARFGHWMAHGEPEDLLAASIYFDLRPIAGAHALAEPLRALIAEGAPAHPRFLRLLAENSLRLKPALSWLGGLDTEAEGEARWVDLKLHGSAVFVEAARLLALACGIDAPTTRERLVQAGQALGAGERERETWASAFEVLQMLRLRVQIDGAAAGHPNRIDVQHLDDIDRRLLKEAMRVARLLQQRVSLDWLR